MGANSYFSHKLEIARKNIARSHWMIDDLIVNALRARSRATSVSIPNGLANTPMTSSAANARPRPRPRPLRSITTPAFSSRCKPWLAACIDTFNSAANSFTVITGILTSSSSALRADDPPRNLPRSCHASGKRSRACCVTVSSSVQATIA